MTKKVYRREAKRDERNLLIESLVDSVGDDAPKSLVVHDGEDEAAVGEVLPLGADESLDVALELLHLDVDDDQVEEGHDVLRRHLHRLRQLIAQMSHQLVHLQSDK